jgi:UDP-glucose 4-epimerase
MTLPFAWVLGSRGLLGSATSTALRGHACEWRPGAPLAWHDPHHLVGQLAGSIHGLATDACGGPWWVVWCAGAGVVGTTGVTLAAETQAFDHLLRHLGVALADGRLAPGGTVFLASSAGGVYAGSWPPPFDELTMPDPISDYGRAKLVQERALATFVAEHPVRAVVGRISNLYGPGQDLAKGQGLISQLCRAHLQGRPVSIYVPLDTIRDYVFAPDCGRMVARLLQLVDQGSAPGTLITKVLASQQGTTVGAVLQELHRVVKRPIRAVLCGSPLGALQVRDLRLRSVIFPEVDALASTPFPVGLHSTFADLRLEFALGHLRAG